MPAVSGRGRAPCLPPPRSWDPLQRAVEDISISIYDLVEIAENLVVNPQPHPPPPHGSGMGGRGSVAPYVPVTPPISTRYQAYRR
jgi:hypothetical protein